MDKPSMKLSRTVRFCIELLGQSPGALASARYNGFAGWPSMAGLGVYYELEVVCKGQPDPVTGYMMNISVIDAAVRDAALPVIERAVQDHPESQPAAVLAEALRALESALGGTLWSVRWRLTPYYSLAMITASPDRVSITQQFEFAASHRLHVESLSAEQNRNLFGKCNNPHSHGHNYRLEVTVAVPLSPPPDHLRLALPELERVVDRMVIKRFDHTHLNLDTVEFARINPSVENIAKVCHDLLADPIAQAGGQLQRVTVWETEKTSGTYPAGDAS